jgi:hypothetical protein
LQLGFRRDIVPVTRQVMDDRLPTFKHLPCRAFAYISGRFRQSDSMPYAMNEKGLKIVYQSTPLYSDQPLSGDLPAMLVASQPTPLLERGSSVALSV